MSRHLLWSLLLLPACLVSRGQGPNGTPSADVDKSSVVALEGVRAAAIAFEPALGSNDAVVRTRALLALARLERIDAVTPILRALHDPDAQVRTTAAFAAGQLDLALDAQRPTHEQQRQTIESALVAALTAEHDPLGRVSLIRALGRVGSRAGLDALAGLATGPSAAERREALFALGVSGARRQASRSGDPSLLVAVESGLLDNDDSVRAAAAYAAFRQKLALPKAAIDNALGGSPQTRIFVARSMATMDPAVANSTLPRLLVDTDWRVQIEAMRALKARGDNTEAILVVLDAAVRSFALRPAGREPAEQLHVITEGCLVVADIGAPTALPALVATVAALPRGPSTAQARCTCAAAIEVLGGDDNAVESCTQGMPAEVGAKHALSVVEHARVPSPEKAKALVAFLNSDILRIRMAAAGVACADPSSAAADVAATRLLDETDPGVAAALLECFADGRNAEMLRDRTISQTVQRFVTGAVFEEIEPLLALALLARTRPGPTMESLRAVLLKHADGRVRDAAADVPTGERAPGPRALALPEPAAGALPLAAILRTTRGDIVIAFERELAPRTVKSFADLAAKGTFNGTPFHRVIADFVAQGGDPRGDGSGGPGFTLPCENTDAPFSRGAVGMAHSGKDTGGSQFFLTHSHQPHLDGRYTLFARVVDGDDVMDSLQKDDVLLSVEMTTALRKARK